MTAAVLACGALAADVRRISRDRGWDVDVHPLPALLHNRPERIAPAVAEALDALRGRYEQVAVAYGDCGTYGALDAVLRERGIDRLDAEHCYDLLARQEVRAALDEEPGTYLLTDFLARTFEHTVVRELGPDRHPDLRDATSAVTGASCGSPSARPRRRGRRRSGPPRGSGSHWRSGRWGMPAWSAQLDVS